MTSEKRRSSFSRSTAKQIAFARLVNGSAAFAYMYLVQGKPPVWNKTGGRAVGCFDDRQHLPYEESITSRYP